MRGVHWQRGVIRRRLSRAFVGARSILVTISVLSGRACSSGSPCPHLRMDCIEVSPYCSIDLIKLTNDALLLRRLPYRHARRDTGLGRSYVHLRRVLRPHTVHPAGRDELAGMVSFAHQLRFHFRCVHCGPCSTGLVLNIVIAELDIRTRMDHRVYFEVRDTSSPPG